jgi:outer membrane protein OmpA-like peptidoglycan-associated protein
MNIRVLLTTSLGILSVAIPTFTGAQNPSTKYGFEINGGIREYGGDRGTRYFFARRPDYQAIGIAFSYNVNPSFDATVYGSSGTLGQRDFSKPRALGFTASITDLVIGLRYKFANNYIMSDQSKIRPYLQAGWGGMQSVSKILHNTDGYAENYQNNRTWFAAQWSAGVGVKFGLTDYLDMSLQSLYNYSFDDNYDGLPFSLSRVRLNALHDAFLYHSIGFTYNFGDNEGIYRFGRDKDEVPKEVIARVNLLSKRILFETASATIIPTSYTDIDSIVEILLDYPTLNALIEGHTDDVGDDAANMTLSQQRADAVKAYLVSKQIEDARLTSKGYGETQPIAKNDTEEGKALNRRVDLKLYYRK